MERQKSSPPCPQLKPSLRFSHTPRADPVKSGAIFRQNLPAPSFGTQSPSSHLRSPQEVHHDSPGPLPAEDGGKSGLARGPGISSSKNNVSASPLDLKRPTNVDGPLIRPSPYGRFFPDPSPTPFGVAAWASSGLGQQISANFDALVRQSPAPRVLQGQARQQALSPPPMRSPPTGALASLKAQTREHASRLMPPPRSSPKSPLKHEAQQQDLRTDLTLMSPQHIKAWVGRTAEDLMAAQKEAELFRRAYEHRISRASPNSATPSLAGNFYSPPDQSERKQESQARYTLLFSQGRLQEGNPKQAEPSGLGLTDYDNQPLNPARQLQPGSVLRSHSKKAKGRTSEVSDQDTFSSPDSQAAVFSMTRSRIKAGMNPGNSSKSGPPESTPPAFRANTKPPKTPLPDAPASSPKFTRTESARQEARGLSTFLMDEGDAADLSLNNEVPPFEDGNDQGDWHNEGPAGESEKLEEKGKEDSERTQSECPEAAAGLEEVVSSPRENPPTASKGVGKSGNASRSGVKSPQQNSSGLLRKENGRFRKQVSAKGDVSSLKKERKGREEVAEMGAESLLSEKEAALSVREQAKRLRHLVSPIPQIETRRSKSRRRSLEETGQLGARNLIGGAMAKMEEKGKGDLVSGEVSDAKKRSGSSRILRELESGLKNADEDTVIMGATKLPETAQLSKRGRLVAPRLAFWKNEFFERDQAGRIVGIIRPSLDKTTPPKSSGVLVKQEPGVKLEGTAVKAPSHRKSEGSGRADPGEEGRGQANRQKSKRLLRGRQEAGRVTAISDKKQGGKSKGPILLQRDRNRPKPEGPETEAKGSTADKRGQAETTLKVTRKRKRGESSKANDHGSGKPTDQLWRLKRGHKLPKMERPPAEGPLASEQHVAEGEPSAKMKSEPSMSDEAGPRSRSQSKAGKTSNGQKKEDMENAKSDKERPIRKRPRIGEGPVKGEGAELQAGNVKKRRLQGPIEDMREHKKAKLVSELLLVGKPVEAQIGEVLANGISPPVRRTKADVWTEEQSASDDISSGKKASGVRNGKRGKEDKAVGLAQETRVRGTEGEANNGRMLRSLRQKSDGGKKESERLLGAVDEDMEVVVKGTGNGSVDGPWIDASELGLKTGAGEKGKSASAVSKVGSQKGAASKDGLEGGRPQVGNENKSRVRTESAKQNSDEQSKSLRGGGDALLQDANKNEDERPVSWDIVSTAPEGKDPMHQGHLSAPQRSHVAEKAGTTEGVLLEKGLCRSGPVHIEPVHIEPVHTQSAAPEEDPADKSGWTASQVAALKDALASIDPTVDGLWYKVARQVPGKNHMECQAKHNEAYATPPIRPHYARRLGMSPPPRIIIQGAGKALANHSKPSGFVGVQMQGIRAAREILRAQQAKQLQEAKDPLAFHVGDLGSVPAVSPAILKPVQPQDKYIDDALHRRLQAQRGNKVPTSADLGFEGVSKEQIEGAAGRIAEAAESARLLREKAAARIEEEEVLVGDEEDEDDDDRPPFA